MQYPVKCIKINSRTPYLLCKITEPQKPVLEVVKDTDSEYKRAFSVRLAEAVKLAVLPKKRSIKDVEKPKRKRRRRKSKK